MTKQRRQIYLVAGSGFVLAAVLLATVGLPERTSPASEPLDDSIVGESYHDDTKASAEANEDADRHKASAAASAPSGIVAREKPEVSTEQVRWAEDFYRAPEAAIKAARYRFIQINWDLFYKELEKSPAYLAASSGRSPPPVYDDSAPTFRFDAFENRSHQLLVTDVRFYGEPGSRRIVMRGQVIGETDGQFKIATTEGRMNLSGQIETANFLVRLDTLRGATMTSVAEIDRQVIEGAAVPIDSQE